MAIERKTVLDQIEKANSKGGYDFVIIGGGSSGLGCGVEAASRGYSVLLLEQVDFGKGTSSKSTKLVHGGVRYLEQGNVPLVYEALKERGYLLQNAPHLVSNRQFLIPNYSFLGGPYYALGLKLYDKLAGQHSFGASNWITRQEAIALVPNIKQKELRDGITYQDGQFDDTRLLVSLLRTLLEHEGTALNYAKFTQFRKNDAGHITGVDFMDMETQISHEVLAKCVVNATGVFSENVYDTDSEEDAFDIRPSRGSHVVVDKKFLKDETAILIPKTSDGRVLFAIPWHGKVIIGTTDQEVDTLTLDPIPEKSEIQFILETASRFLEDAPKEKDVLSVFAGLRPLVDTDSGGLSKAISRGHKVIVSQSGLITISGGKWTTYRKMGEDTIARGIAIANLEHKKSVTQNLSLFGSMVIEEDDEDVLDVYGIEAKMIRALCKENPSLGELIHERLPYIQAQVIWACRYEMARTIEDVLARRVRALFLDAHAALESAEIVANLMAKELNLNEDWKSKQMTDFKEIALKYIYSY